MPISYADAQPLLAALAGPVAPEIGGARCRSPITSAQARKVHLAIASDWGQKPVYDVIAKIPGSSAPDEWVIRGNHRDGWVFGRLGSVVRHDRDDGRSARRSAAC